MGFLAKIFNKSAKHTQKLHNNIELNDIANFEQAKLTALATAEEELALRLEAINHLDDDDTLIRLSKDLNQARISLAAQTRLATLLDNKKIDIETIKAHYSAEQLLSLVSYCRDTSFQQAVLPLIEQQSVLAELAMTGQVASLRQFAAQQLEDEEQLSQLVKASKGRDKAVYRIAKHRLEQIKEQQRAADEQANKIASLINHVEQLAQRAYDPQFSAKVALFESQWQALQSIASVAEISRVNSALAQCRSEIEKAAVIAQQEAERLQALANIDQDRKVLIAQQKALLFSLYMQPSAELPTKWKADREEVTGNWLKLNDLKAAEADTEKQFNRLSAAIDRVANLMNEHGSLNLLVDNLQQLESDSEQEPASLYALLAKYLNSIHFLDQEPLPEALRIAQQLHEAYSARQRADKEKKETLIRQINGLIRKGNDAIQQGQLRRSSGVAKNIKEKRHQLSQLVDPLPDFLEKKLQQYDEDLTKLQDWQSYAVVPKKKGLVSQMEQLIDSELDPKTLADQIHWLQQEWKALSKGGKDQHQALWEQFHQAAQQAYAPCKHYFEQQAQVRQHNLEQRKTLAQQLTDYAANDNWSGVDWKAVEKLISVSKTQWRQLSPIERQANKPVQQQFDAAIKQVQNRLGEEYQINVDLKQQLITEAEKLDTEPDIRIAIEQVKLLQARWQKIGVTPRRVDQKLWIQFRQYCNNIFEKRAEQSVAFKAELAEHKQAALALIEQVTAYCKAGSAEFMANIERVAQAKADFAALGPLPKEEITQLQAQFNAAVEQFYRQVKLLKSVKNEQQWSNLFSLAKKVSEYEELSGEDNTEIKAQIEAELANNISLPKGGEAIIKQRLQNGCAQNVETMEANLKQLNELCLRMEICMDKPSPVSEQSQRMSFQVRMLQDGFGQGATDDPNELKLLWASVPFVDKAQYNKLFQRFKTAFTPSE